MDGAGRIGLRVADGGRRRRLRCPDGVDPKARILGSKGQLLALRACQTTRLVAVRENLQPNRTGAAPAREREHPRIERLLGQREAQLRDCELLADPGVSAL